MPAAKGDLTPYLLGEPINLLSGLTSLGRMSRRDQRELDRRLRALAARAKATDTYVAANLLRASYELDTADRF